MWLMVTNNNNVYFIVNIATVRITNNERWKNLVSTYIDCTIEVKICSFPPPNFPAGDILPCGPELPVAFMYSCFTKQNTADPTRTCV